MASTSKTKLYALAADLHYPVHDRVAWAAVMDYLRRNPVDGFVWMGDQLDNQEVSHWTKGKGIYRKQGALATNLKGFSKDILDPLDEVLGPAAERVWITGNHERFITIDLIEEQPELDGMLNLDSALRLQERGYTVIGLGGHIKVGGSHLHAIHGDQVGGGANPAKKVVDTWCQSVVMAHVHTLQQYTKASPAHDRKRWTGTTLPCLSETNPGYGRGRANTWLTGFGLVSVRPDRSYNLFPIVITDGQFSMPDGQTYGRKQRKAA